MRWGQKVVGISQTEAAAILRIDTPDGEYALSADWVVAADGGRSTIRKLLGLRMEGRSYPGNFVIADIKAEIDLPTERLCYFDPAWNPGNNVLVHRQPDSMWRIDFRLPDEETPEQALEVPTLSRRIEAVLEMIHRQVPWQLDWATVYSANTLTLPEFVQGRILFTGDAAHLLPIFGVRGCNTGLQDCNNLAWKLAFVVKGWSSPSLLGTYSSERVQAAREICEEAGKSTRFMTPPTAGARLMRDAVLSFSLSEEFPKELLHWRTSRPHDYHNSPLNSFPGADAAFTGGAAAGQPARNVKLGEDDYLLDRIDARAGFHLLIFTGAAPLSGDLERILIEAAREAFPVNRVLIGTRIDEAGSAGRVRRGRWGAADRRQVRRACRHRLRAASRPARVRSLAQCRCRPGVPGDADRFTGRVMPHRRPAAPARHRRPDWRAPGTAWRETASPWPHPPDRSRPR